MTRARILFSLLLFCGLTPAQTGTLPNIVYILADDMGIDSVAAFNPRSNVPTPNIDRLSQQGMSFMDAHSGSAVCTPTRYGVLTGRYSWRTRMKSGIVGKWEGPLIPKGRLTVASMLKSAGYATACIGKWHLGWLWRDKDGKTTNKAKQVDFSKVLGGGPTTLGFDSYFGDDVPNWPPYAWIENDRLTAIPTETMPEDDSNGVRRGPRVKGWRLDAVLQETTGRCVSYIRQQAKTKKPFFLYFAMTTPHTPINPSPAFLGKSGVSPYADLLMETDWAVGAVMKALEEAGVSENTLVIFTADNGTSPKCQFKDLEKKGVHLRENFRGHKADIWEGGHRVPFIARWPRRIKAGSRSRTPISLVDFMRTAAEVIKYKLPAEAAEDSVSLIPHFEGRKTASDREVVCHSSQGFFAVRSGKWKAEFCYGSGGWSAPRGQAARKAGLPPVQLYDMEKDPRESTNLAAKHPEIVESLRRALRRSVERGRSTPGPDVQNDNNQVWWQKLPWPRPE